MGHYYVDDSERHTPVAAGPLSTPPIIEEERSEKGEGQEGEKVTKGGGTVEEVEGKEKGHEEESKDHSKGGNKVTILVLNQDLCI